MKLWQFALAPLACLAVAGCRTNPNITLLERELRLQEDKIYALQECVEDHQAELQTARRENAALRERLGTGQPGSDQPVDVRRPAGIGGPTSAPLGPPVIDLPTESLPAGEVPRRQKQSGHLPPGPRRCGGR